MRSTLLPSTLVLLSTLWLSSGAQAAKATPAPPSPVRHPDPSRLAKVLKASAELRAARADFNAVALKQAAPHNVEHIKGLTNGDLEHLFPHELVTIAHQLQGGFAAFCRAYAAATKRKAGACVVDELLSGAKESPFHVTSQLGLQNDVALAGLVKEDPSIKALAAVQAKLSGTAAGFPARLAEALWALAANQAGDALLEALDDEARKRHLVVVFQPARDIKDAFLSYNVASAFVPKECEALASYQGKDLVKASDFKPGPGCSVVVQVDPNARMDEVTLCVERSHRNAGHKACCDGSGVEEAPPLWLVLGHELVHAWHFIGGTNAPRAMAPAAPCWTDLEEQRTIVGSVDPTYSTDFADPLPRRSGLFSENWMRAEELLPMRVCHKGSTKQTEALGNRMKLAGFALQLADIFILGFTGGDVETPFAEAKERIVKESAADQATLISMVAGESSLVRHVSDQGEREGSLQVFFEELGLKPAEVTKAIQSARH